MHSPRLDSFYLSVRNQSKGCGGGKRTHKNNTFWEEKQTFLHPFVQFLWSECSLMTYSRRENIFLTLTWLLSWLFGPELISNDCIAVDSPLAQRYDHQYSVSKHFLSSSDFLGCTIVRQYIKCILGLLPANNECPTLEQIQIHFNGYDTYSI